MTMLAEPMEKVKTVSEARAAAGRTKVATRDVSVFYGEKQALFEVSLDIPANR